MKFDKTEALKDVKEILELHPTLISEVVCMCGSMMEQFKNEALKSNNGDLATWLEYSTGELFKSSRSKEHKSHIIKKSAEVLEKVNGNKGRSPIMVQVYESIQYKEEQ